MSRAGAQLRLCLREGAKTEEHAPAEPEAPAAEATESAPAAEEPKKEPAEPEAEVVRAKADKLTGPTVVGKIDLPVEQKPTTAGEKRKRKRIVLVIVRSRLTWI